MAQVDIEYHKLLKDILNNGTQKTDRTGTGTFSVFGRQLKFSLKDNTIPIITTKKIHTKGVIEELLWFLRGETNLKSLVDKNINIWVGDAHKNYCKHTSENSSKWDEWMRDNGDGTLSMYTKKEFIEKIKTDEKFAEKWGELGPIYGKQWRNWESYKNYDVTRYQVKQIDQIQNLINDLKTNPDSRRLIVNAWNVGELEQMVLPPCHYGFQCYTRLLSINERLIWAKENYPNLISNEGWEKLYSNFKEANEWFEKFDIGEIIPSRALSLMWNQRSVGTPLGLPFNIASYGILTHILAKECNMVAEELKCNLGDTHIYLNQIDGINQQLQNDVNKYSDAKILIKDFKDVFNINSENIEILSYKSYPAIDMPLSN